MTEVRDITAHFPGLQKVGENKTVRQQQVWDEGPVDHSNKFGRQKF
jgi:hypothetical protein